MSDCRKLQESIAAGELPEAGAAHLERCPDCAALARDVEQLRAAAQGLPRPRCPERRGRSIRPASAQPRLVLAAVALLLLLVGLVLRFAPRGASPPEPERVDAPSIDLFALIDRAQQVWAPAAGGTSELAWLQLDPIGSRAAGVSEIDPLAGIRPAALLLAADAQNGARSDNPASSPTRETGQRRKP